MLTPFGKEVRKLRIDKDISLAKMAKDLNMQTSYLSAIENGRKPVPNMLVNSVHKYFSWSGNTKKHWKELAELSTTQFKLDLSDADELDRKLILSFGRKAKALPNKDKEKILKLLDK